jgi:nicotinamide riboside kinase
MIKNSTSSAADGESPLDETADRSQFLRRALASLAHAGATKVYIAADDVIARLDRMLVEKRLAISRPNTAPADARR